MTNKSRSFNKTHHGGDLSRSPPSKSEYLARARGLRWL